MTKYHITKKGEPAVCRATKGVCPLGAKEEHYATKEEAQKAFETSQRTFQPNIHGRVPILLEPSKVADPDTWNLYFTGVEDFTDSEPLDYYNSSSYSDMTWVDPKGMISHFMGLKKWPADLEELYEQNKDEWENIDNWDLEHGYYDGDSPILSFPEGFSEKLTSWYYNQPNAIDMQGVLEHVREKGFDTTGLSPVEAIKKLLREENGIVLKHVERATSVSRRNIKLKDLTFAKGHYGKINGDEPVPMSKNSKEIMGVARYMNGAFRLLDGHHRLKWANENQRTDGEFLVLY